MPTYYVNPFGLETPTTTNAYPSLPSTILPDSPELDLPHIDTRSNTPDGQTQLRVDDIPGYKGKLVKVLVAFKLYVVSKNKKKEKTWVPCGSTSEFPVDVTLGVTDFDQFRELVAAACNLHFKSTGGIIRESIEDPVRMPLAWLVSIPRVDEWKKSDKVKMKDASDYQDWLVTAFRAGKKSVGLDIRMTDPAEAKRRAKKEDLLAKREARAAAVKASASKKRKAKNGRGGSGGGGDGGGGGDSGGGGGGGGGPDGAYSEVSSDTDNSGSEIDADDFDDINFHMRSIYRAHPTNVTYDRLIPVYIDPTNPRRYILLSTAAVQTWAKDLMERTAGVSLQAPPRSLKYITMSPSKRAKFEQTVGNDNVNLLGQILVALQNNAGTPIERHAMPTSSPPNESDMEAYLEFISVRNKDEVLEVLTANDLTSYKIFKGGLPRKDVMDLGLTLGTVTKLFENTAKFDRHLGA
ncbi:hypothetical protein PGT21_037067 [Puccinia graminis f. sp. tritici]|uniref:Uncharacterized protein n=1 Tax=Puccinia graminis f. sp. tritici TaxID=56615 RepID=A0A5B0R3R0_PUCGR|nr:hypothetical protein PGT21_037067 [Puccinia graminis f. sp. tritici]